MFFIPLPCPPLFWSPTKLIDNLKSFTKRFYLKLIQNWLLDDIFLEIVAWVSIDNTVTKGNDLSKQIIVVNITNIPEVSPFKTHVCSIKGRRPVEIFLGKTFSQKINDWAKKILSLFFYGETLSFFLKVGLNRFWPNMA